MVGKHCKIKIGLMNPIAFQTIECLVDVDADADNDMICLAAVDQATHQLLVLNPYIVRPLHSRSSDACERARVSMISLQQKRNKQRIML